VRLDFTFVLWVGTLLLSAAAVVVFLLLMREEPGRETEDGRRKTNEDPGRSAD
jgi:hypothetical protein